MSSITLLSWLGGLITIVFGIGFYFGGLQYNKSQLDRDLRIIRLQDSLVLIQSSLNAIPSNSISEQDTTQEKK